MPDYRKPPYQPTPRHDASRSPAPDDSGGFSIETTQMRLKSIKLRRTEAEVAQISNAPAPKDTLPEKFMQSDRPAGRVRHDERGMAVWDWAVASGEFAALSATNMMKKLEIDDLKIEETQRAVRSLAQPVGRDVGGGGDPYNQRGSGQRPGEAAQRQGITGSPDRPRNAVLDQLTGPKK
ncbi:MAG: hypothetical protein H7Y89_10480 [Steroidobacteraceae bacterium]|nr:hypothetical protein [Steroidobacteraceae bacterium]